MKLSYALLILLVLTIICSINAGASLLSIKNFNYDVVRCDKTGESSSDTQSSNDHPLTGSSSFTLEDRLGSVDGGGVSSSSESGVEATCDNGQIMNEIYVKFEECVVIAGFNYKFSVDYNNGQVTQKYYTNYNCTEDDQTSTQVFQLDVCNDDCKTNPTLYSVVQFSDIDITTGELVFVYFNCLYNQTEWKSAFYSIQVIQTNKCQTTGESISQLYSCNKDFYSISTSPDYNCNVYNSHTTVETGYTGCYDFIGNINICNV